MMALPALKVPLGPEVLPEIPELKESEVHRGLGDLLALMDRQEPASQARADLLGQEALEVTMDHPALQGRQGEEEPQATRVLKVQEELLVMTGVRVLKVFWELSVPKALKE